MERFEEFEEVSEDKKDHVKEGAEVPVVDSEDRAVEVRGVELDDEGRERR